MKQLLRTTAIAMATALCISATPAYAAETVLAEADFSTLTAGSEDAPDIFKYSFNFTGFTGWNIVTNKTGAAGGSLYLGDGGSIKSPYLSGVSTTGGAIKVSAVVKLNKADAGIIKLTWGVSNTQQYILESTDWETIEFFVQPTSASSYSNQALLAPEWLADGIFVKSIKIAQSPEFLAPPTVNQPTNADGTSFTATWKAVTSATKYFIDVYSYAADGSKAYFIENQETTTTSYKVEGLDPATTYYFVVRASNENGTSGNSTEIEVVKYLSSLGTPVVNIESCDEDGNFTAVWPAVADADSYTVNILKTSVLSEAGEANVLTEDFNAFTTGTLSSVEYIYARHLEVLNEPGWDGYNMACIDGAIGIIPYGSDAYLITPAIDLSGDNGKVSVHINMCSNSYGTFKTGDTVSFCIIDAEGNESTPVEVTITEAAFADYTVALTGGAANNKIKISSATSNKIFIDNLEIKQLLPAGTTTTSTYLTDSTEASSYTGKVEFGADIEYAFTAIANGRTVSGGEISGISSAASAPVLIQYTTGISAALSEAAVTIQKAGKGLIAVSTPEALTVEIYDLAGRLAGTVAVAPGTSVISAGTTGVVIVKAGTATAKIAL